MPACGLYALAAGNNHGKTFVAYFLKGKAASSPHEVWGGNRWCGHVRDRLRVRDRCLRVCRYPAESCPPVMPVVRLSDMITTILLFSLMASRRPVIPECVKVESPIMDTAGNWPASAAPLAIVIDAPMSTQESIALKGLRIRACSSLCRRTLSGIRTLSGHR